MEFNKNEIKKELYRTKVDARLFYYRKGQINYTVQVNDGIYKFPIDVVEQHTEKLVVPTMLGPFTKDVEIMKLSADLGDTPFDARIPAKLLIRWIEKAIDMGEFMLVKSLKPVES